MDVPTSKPVHFIAPSSFKQQGKGIQAHFPAIQEDAFALNSQDH